MAMDKETERRLLTFINVIAATMIIIAICGSTQDGAQVIIGKLLRPFHLEDPFFNTLPWNLFVLFGFGVSLAMINFLGLKQGPPTGDSDDKITKEDIENGIICKMKGMGWDSNDYSRGWLITGKTGSGKTAGAIMKMMRQIFLRADGKHGIQKWGGVAVDQKGDFWEIVEGFAKQFDRKDDLIMLKTRPKGSKKAPAHSYNIISYKGITRTTYAQLVIDCSKSVDGKGQGDPFWDNSARNAIENSFYLTDSIEELIRYNPLDDLNKIRQRIAYATANNIELYLEKHRGGPVYEPNKNETARMRDILRKPLKDYATLKRLLLKYDKMEGWNPDYERFKKSCETAQAKLENLYPDIKMNEIDKEVEENNEMAYLDSKMQVLDQKEMESAMPTENRNKLEELMKDIRAAADACREKRDIADQELSFETFTSLATSYRLLTTNEIRLRNTSEASKWLLAEKMSAELLNNIRVKESKDAIEYLLGDQFLGNKAKETLNSIVSFIGTFLKPFADPYMAEVYSAKRNSCDFSEIDNGKIFTVSMPQAFGIQRRYANTIMKLLFYQHSLNRFDEDENNPKKPSEKNNLIFWADEAQGVVTATANMSDYSVIDRTRAARATVVFATQSVTSFMTVLSKDQVDVLLLNMANQIHFQAADENGAKFIAAQIGKAEITDRTYSLSKGSRTVNLAKKEQYHIRDFELMGMKKFQAVLLHCEQGYVKCNFDAVGFDGTRKFWKSKVKSPWEKFKDLFSKSGSETKTDGSTAGKDATAAPESQKAKAVEEDKAA